MSDAELRDRLAAVLGEPVLALTRRRSGHPSSVAVDEVDLVTGEGRGRRLVLKDVGPAALSPTAAGAKQAWERDPGRELATYREVLGPWAVDAPACHGTVDDPATGHPWLVLEAVDGHPLWQDGDPAAWDAAAAWLGRLHARGAPGWGGRLLPYDAGLLHARLDAAVAQARPGALGPVVAVWDRVVERLASWPRALVHGDFYASNVLVAAGEDGSRIRPVDWELAGTGPGVLDLAALTAGSWTREERERMACSYHAAWAPPAGRPQLRALLDALEHARLALAVQWLGRPPAWIPPPEHAQPWLAVALEAAEGLRG